MKRYFPELAEGLPASIPKRCVLDGEVVIVGDGGLQFESLQMRIHPASSRVTKLGQQSPAAFVAWDLLTLDDRDFTVVAFEQRRRALEQALAKASPPLFVTPMTRDRALAVDWFGRFEGAGFDGIIAKEPDS